jgi:hypothetical protein
MLLSELMPELSEIGIGPVGSWEIHGKKGITLGDPKKYFPYRTGPQIPIDCTKANNPDLSEEEVRTIRRRFGIEEA